MLVLSGQIKNHQGLILQECYTGPQETILSQGKISEGQDSNPNKQGNWPMLKTSDMSLLYQNLPIRDKIESEKWNQIKYHEASQLPKQ